MRVLSAAVPDQEQPHHAQEPAAQRLGGRAQTSDENRHRGHRHLYDSAAAVSYPTDNDDSVATDTTVSVAAHVVYTSRSGVLVSDRFGRAFAVNGYRAAAVLTAMTGRKCRRRVPFIFVFIVLLRNKGIGASSPPAP